HSELYTLSLHDALPISFVTKDQTGGTDSQVRQLGKTINQRLSQAFGKIFAVRFGAPVLKRQDCDRVNRDLGIARVQKHTKSDRADRKSTRLNSSHVAIS